MSMLGRMESKVKQGREKGHVKGHVKGQGPRRPWRVPHACIAWGLGGLLAATPLLSQAQSTSWDLARSFSIGAAGTATHWRTGCLNTTQCDRNHTGWRLTAAWHFAPQGALEWVATDQGRVRAEGMGDQGLRSSELRMQGMGLNVAWLLPLNQEWQLAARAGIIGNRARFSETTVAVLGSEEYSRTRTDPMLGLGLSWKLNPSVSLDGRLDWTSTRLAPAPQSLIGGGSVPSHQWGLGLTAYF